MAGAAAGTGAGVAITGEPGAGKSAVVEAACARSTGLRVLRGGCDPLATPRPLGPFRDLAAAEFGPLVTDGLLSDVCEAVYAALRTAPTVLVVEDVHWIDAASVEVLRFVARRLEAMSCAVVITYRDDEVGPQHPARPLLGDFAVLGHLTTLRLDPLSERAVGELLGNSPWAADRVYSLTGGNPFFVAEVAKEPDRPLPATVRDAVLARTWDIAPEDFEVLQLAAAAPDRLDDRVLPTLGVDLPTLRRLYDTGLLLRNREGLVFRHELARLALESTIPASGVARLHARLLDALEQIEPRDPAVLTHHAVAATDSRRATAYAREAAGEAARAGSHTEAVAFLETALAHLADGRPAERAELQMQLATEQYMIGALDEAIALVSATFPIWRQAGDEVGLSAAHEACAIFEYYNARRREAEELAERAAELAPDGTSLAYGSARATRAYLAYHEGEYAFSAACSADAVRIADSTHNHALALRSRMVGAVADLALGDNEARERVIRVIEQARAADLDELASSGYSNLSYLDVEHRRLRAAERVLEVSLPFTVERDIAVCNHWQTAVRTRLRFVEGRWSAALEDAEEALTRRGMPLATFWPHVVSGLVPLRRARTVNEHLDAAWRLAKQLVEPLRILPALSAIAERMWLTGTVDDRVTTVAPVEIARAAGAPALSWAVGELVVWLRRLELDVCVDADALAEPFRLTLAGRTEEAAAWWRRVGAVYEEALVLAGGAALEHRIAGVERLDLLGATATADRLRRVLRQEGVATLPQRPRSSTRANPSGLTNRQLDVAKLVARGFTNAEIADRLFISTKTTDHHVSAVLTKLGMPSRRAVVVQAAELGLS